MKAHMKSWKELKEILLILSLKDILSSVFISVGLTARWLHVVLEKELHSSFALHFICPI